MGDSVKALRHVLLGEVRGASVTRADLSGAGTLALDPEVMAAAGFFEHEKVEVYDATCGTRLSMPVVSGDEGVVAVTGAAAYLVHQGDVIAVAAYGWMKEKAASRHAPRLVTLDAHNRLVAKASGGSEAPKKNKAPHPMPFRRAHKKGG